MAHLQPTSARNAIFNPLKFDLFPSLHIDREQYPVFAEGAFFVSHEAPCLYIFAGLREDKNIPLGNDAVYIGIFNMVCRSEGFRLFETVAIGRLSTCDQFPNIYDRRNRNNDNQYGGIEHDLNNVEHHHDKRPYEVKNNPCDGYHCYDGANLHFINPALSISGQVHSNGENVNV